MVNYFGEGAKTTPPSVFFPVFVRFIRAYKVRTRSSIFPHFCNDRVQLSLLVRWEVPWFHTRLLSVSVRAEQGRALAASVPQDVAYSPRPNNRKSQLGLTPELQLWCLDWFSPLPLPLSLISFTPGQPRPAPTHSTFPEIVLSLDLWDLLRKCATQGFLCTHVCLYEWLKDIVWHLGNPLATTPRWSRGERSSPGEEYPETLNN